MQTYYFTALHDERYAAIGEVQAESPEEAKAKIIERYHDEGLNFCDYVDGDEPDHFMLTDEAGEEYHLEDETPPAQTYRFTPVPDQSGTIHTPAHRRRTRFSTSWRSAPPVRSMPCRPKTAGRTPAASAMPTIWPGP